MLNSTHDMYQPDRRARSAAPKAPRSEATARAEREKWMRELQQTKEAARKRRDQIERVIRKVCRDYEITKTGLLSGSRLPQISAARRQICLTLYGKVSHKELGRALRIHHTSVMYHVRQVDPPRPVEPPYNPDLADESGVWNI